MVKVCLYADYEYIWVLDICIKFYTSNKLSLEDSNTRCNNEEGSLIILDSQLKDLLFLPCLLNVYSEYIKGLGMYSLSHQAGSNILYFSRYSNNIVSSNPAQARCIRYNIM